MRILAIESSCDESAAAYLDMTDGKVAAFVNVVASQAIHAKYGGVVPEVAAREHAVTLPVVLEQLTYKVTGTKDGRMLAEQVDAIAVTRGPGLVTSLRVGIDIARTLAAAWRKPLVGVNHIEGHLYSNWLPGGAFAGVADADVSMFPAVCLVVSGGHTELLLMRGHGDYSLLGATRDDAAGETFDKTAKLLGLGYPGGPKLSKRAITGNRAAVALPRPMLHDAHLDFSFSGLKTAVRYFLHDRTARLSDDAFIDDVAASTEAAIVDVLVAKTVRAAREHGARSVLLAGGVAANGHLRERLAAALADELPDVRSTMPALEHCGDNAAMIAMAAYHGVRAGHGDDWRTMDVKIGWELGREGKGESEEGRK